MRGPEREEKGVVVVGPAAARWAGAKIRRRAYIEGEKNNKIINKNENAEIKMGERESIH